jgi:hypothetical protein
MRAEYGELLSLVNKKIIQQKKCGDERHRLVNILDKKCFMEGMLTPQLESGTLLSHAAHVQAYLS